MFSLSEFSFRLQVLHLILNLSCTILLHFSSLWYLELVKCMVCQPVHVIYYYIVGTKSLHIANIHFIPRRTVWLRSSLPVAFVQHDLASSSSVKKTSNSFLANEPASGGGQQFTLWNGATAASDGSGSTKCYFDFGFPQTTSACCIIM